MLFASAIELAYLASEAGLAAESSGIGGDAPVADHAAGAPEASGTQQKAVIPSERSESRNLAVAVAVRLSAQRDSSLRSE